MMNDQELQERIENNLSLSIGYQKPNILKTALKRLKLTYIHLFYAEEDPKIYMNIKVYDNFDSYLDEMGDDIFSLEEKAIIEETREALDQGPDEIKLELETHHRWYI